MVNKLTALAILPPTHRLFVRGCCCAGLGCQEHPKTPSMQTPSRTSAIWKAMTKRAAPVICASLAERGSVSNRCRLLPYLAHGYSIHGNNQECCQGEGIGHTRNSLQHEGFTRAARGFPLSLHLPCTPLAPLHPTWP